MPLHNHLVVLGIAATPDTGKQETVESGQEWPPFLAAPSSFGRQPRRRQIPQICHCIRELLVIGILGDVETHNVSNTCHIIKRRPRR